MTLDALIMFVGALVAMLPFLGFPNSWDTVLFFVLGIVVIALGIIVRRRDSHHVSPRQTFIEKVPMNNPVIESQENK